MILQVSDEEHPLPVVNNMSRRERINLWLYEILRESHTTRVIMRDLTMDRHAYVLGMRIWLEEVLKAWDVDEAAAGVEQPYDLSDGAVDSRDSLEVLEVPWALYGGFQMFISLTRKQTETTQGNLQMVHSGM